MYHLVLKNAKKTARVDLAELMRRSRDLKTAGTSSCESPEIYKSFIFNGSELFESTADYPKFWQLGNVLDSSLGNDLGTENGLLSNRIFLYFHGDTPTKHE